MLKDADSSPNDRIFKFRGQGIEKVTSAFRAACRKAGIPYGRKTPNGVTFHILRHTFASWLAIMGTPMRTLQELLGHKKIETTNRYAHLNEGVMQDAVELLAGEPFEETGGTRLSLFDTQTISVKSNHLELKQ